MTPMTWLNFQMRHTAVAAVLLLLLAVSVSPVDAKTAADFTADEQSSTLAYLQKIKDANTPLETTWAGADFCTWYGVNCDSNGGVLLDMDTVRWATDSFAVSFPELGDDVDGSFVVFTDFTCTGGRDFGPCIVGTLPESFGRLKQLRKLDIPDSLITGTLPAAWGGMTSMKELLLDGNSFVGTLPPQWSKLRNLTRLDIGSNKLSGSLPASWAALSALTSFSAASNNITGEIPCEWGTLPALTAVSLTSNNLCGCLPDGWKDNNSISVNVDVNLSAADCAATNICTTATKCSIPTTTTPTTTETTERPTTTTTTTENPTTTTTTPTAMLCDVAGCDACASESPKVCAVCMQGYEMGTLNISCKVTEDGGAAWPSTGLMTALVAAVMVVSTVTGLV